MTSNLVHQKARAAMMPRQAWLDSMVQPSAMPPGSPPVKVWKPRRIGSRWLVTAQVRIGDQPVLLHMVAPAALAEAAYSKGKNLLTKFVAFSGDEDEVGCGGCSAGGFSGYDEDQNADALGSIWDAIDKGVSITKGILDTPAIKAVVNQVPYGPQIMLGVQGATAVYSGVRAGTKGAKKRLKKIKAAAVKGDPQAKRALTAIATVAKADKLRVQIKRGNPKAFKLFQKMQGAVASKDPAAFEAAAILQQLDRTERRKKAMTSVLVSRDRVQARAAQQGGSGQFSPRPSVMDPNDSELYPVAYDAFEEAPIEAVIDMDADAEEIGGEIGSAIQWRQSMSDKDRVIHAHLQAMARRAMLRAVSRGA